MASEHCLTCGHTKNSHFFNEEQYVSKEFTHDLHLQAIKKLESSVVRNGK
jgi:hypothetical protein